MPEYSIVVPVAGDTFPDRLDRKAFELIDGDRTYSVAKVRVSYPGQWLAIQPIGADTPRAAYDIVAGLLNGCFNVLCAIHEHLSFLRNGFYYQNLADPKDRGAVGLVDMVQLPFDWSEFPSVLATDYECRSGSFYRKAFESDDPVDQVRYFCLAIEEAGKRIKDALGNNKQGEERVISDTIVEVYKKADRFEELKAIRAGIPNAHLSPDYHDGQKTVQAAMADFLYQHVRCKVMHAGPTAKTGSSFFKDTFAPYSPADRQQALEVLPVVKDVAGMYVRHEFSLAAAGKVKQKAPAGGKKK